MIKFSKEKVLHQILVEATGGSVGVRDEGLLDSALEEAFAGFGDKEFYPTKEEKGARLGYTQISNHAFVDGNKRIGMGIHLIFCASILKKYSSNHCRLRYIPFFCLVHRLFFMKIPPMQYNYPT